MSLVAGSTTVALMKYKVGDIVLVKSSAGKAIPRFHVKLVSISPYIWTNKLCYNIQNIIISDSFCIYAVMIDRFFNSSKFWIV